ncbi:hypothetical protein SAMN04489761_2911 [Tenacibaculum sp. MAR_2009_124]|nr:hypothetical protein SAMN04489761_2911 [Tenacibaculum sp. MAR_2009_124]
MEVKGETSLDSFEYVYAQLISIFHIETLLTVCNNI